MATAVFDPTKYKQTTREQWQTAAAAWHRWEPTIEAWLGSATEAMLDMVDAHPGQHILDVAAGAGGQTLSAAKRVGPQGYVLATDISPNILTFAAQEAKQAHLSNVETRMVDGEELDLPPASFDIVISRVGLIYFPNQHKALQGMRRTLKPGGRLGVIVYSTPENNQFFSIPVSIIRRRAQLPPPFPGQPGPFSLGAPGVLADTLQQAGFTQVQTRVLSAPLRMRSAAECVRFEKESFGALHQMLSGLTDADKSAAWDEIEKELSRFENNSQLEGPCELLIGVGTNPE
jgi:SAM-dependent methyltransferase